jgi:hypothetical protein
MKAQHRTASAHAVEDSVKDTIARSLPRETNRSAFDICRI